MKIELHYAPLSFTGDIPVFEFNTNDELSDYVGEILKKPIKDIVYIAAIGDEVFVSDNKDLILMVFSGHLKFLNYGGGDVFLQEYHDFEEAYEVALEMQEGKSNCYTVYISGNE